MLIVTYFVLSPYINGIKQLKENPDLLFKKLNLTLIFMGLGISFSSLQDTSKTQNKFSKKNWENPKKEKIMIAFMSFMILCSLIFGLIGYFSTEVGVLKELSIGIIVLGLGMFGLLKASIEMFENHRKDKNTGYNTV
ncbi:hypothetical protein KO506_16850 [Polaribacter vadi]|uniref:hypothetical protein n=1 Tax=Polaribacter TaxID=52959 RepID=UPI001C0A3312|nr:MULTISPECIES: hypothetical protein [Polaribacter]MBU3013084.1 hypothetical protein [Polaribacter vadi]MDO6742903.1 hypothetical protein [Polaribacter sp. 1_MG-2023]